MSKVVLAFSGGLDTSVSIHWLRTQRNLRVLTFTANVGQGDSLNPLADTALKLGADSAQILDLQEEFLRDYAFAALRASARHESGHLLAAALTRPLIVRELARIAEEENCEFVAHGGTAKGHNQLRFELGIAAVAPHLKVIAPLREWPMHSREEEIAYARRHGLPIALEREARFSIDRNLWGWSYKAGDLEDPWETPPEDLFHLTRGAREAPDEPRVLEIGFERGTPVSIDGELLGPVPLAERLNPIAGEQGVGRLDVIEDRLLGIKSREVYESPAATVLHTAHRALEQMTLSASTYEFKEVVARRFAEIVYRGYWFTDLRECLQAFSEKTQERVTGEVRVRLHKGSVTVEGRRSPYALYDRRLSTYGAGEHFRASAATGFIDILSLPLKTEALQRDRFERDEK